MIEGRDGEGGTMTTYELVKLTGGVYELLGDYPTREDAYRAASEWGPGDYGVGETDAGHYDEELAVDPDGHVRVRVGVGPWQPTS